MQTAISKPRGNHTHTQNLQKIQTQKRKSNPNTTVKMDIKSQEKRTKEERKKKKSLEINLTNNKIALKAYILIITLNVKGLNVQTKRHKLAEWIQK